MRKTRFGASRVHFGVTGERKAAEVSIIQLGRKVLSFIIRSVPLAVGFGISKLEHFKSIILGGAEGDIFASAFVNIVHKHQET